MMLAALYADHCGAGLPDGRDGPDRLPSSRNDIHDGLKTIVEERRWLVRTLTSQKTMRACR